MSGKLPVLDVKSSSNVSTFQKCMRMTLISGQFFALAPVYGISSENVTHVKYIRGSWKYMYALFSLFGQFWFTGMSFYKFFVMETTWGTITGIVFYGTTITTMIMFINIAKKWPKLVRYVSKIEELDPIAGSRLLYKCNFTCGLVLLMSLAEHLLSVIADVIRCHTCYPLIPLDTYEKFIKHVYYWIFGTVPYNFILGFCCQFVQIQATFTWNFCDLFVICMSYYLTARLQQVNMKLRLVKGKVMPENFWRSVREEYVRATQLVRKVDDVINGIVFISFANNLFFICLQLFYTLENGLGGKKDCRQPNGVMSLGPTITVAYFVFSLVYLIIRSVSVSLIAADVNTTSKEPASILYEVPSSSYCVEVQRFLTQVNDDKVTISGLKFFNITRGLLLTVVGTIITYELVMFQINSPSLGLAPITTAPVTSDDLSNDTAFV